ncbi:MAG: hypothetical protein V8T01_01675 [Oscillospiraceae bacterium]
MRMSSSMRSVAGSMTRSAPRLRASARFAATGSLTARIEGIRFLRS